MKMKLRTLRTIILALIYTTFFSLVSFEIINDYIGQGATISTENIIASIIISYGFLMLFALLPWYTIEPKQVHGFQWTLKSFKKASQNKADTNIAETIKPILFFIFIIFFILSPIVMLDTSTLILKVLINFHRVITIPHFLGTLALVMPAVLVMLIVFTYIFVRYATIFKLAPYMENLLFVIKPEDRKEFIKDTIPIYYMSILCSIVSALPVFTSIFSTTLYSIQDGLLQLSIALLMLAVIVAKNDYDKPFELMHKLGLIKKKQN